MTPKINPLLEKVRMAGATFALPSRGLFYHSNEVEFENGKPEVYVSPMTTVDELAITSVDKLLNGTAIDEVFARCIPSIKNVRGMLARDVDYLVIALRVVSFGPNTPINYQHNCTDAKSHKYEVDVETLILDRTKRFEESAATTFEGDLSNGNHIKIHPMTYGDLLIVQEKLDDMRKAQLAAGRAETRSERGRAADALETASFDYFKTMATALIDSVDGIEDRDNIREWVSVLPIPLRKQLLELFESIEAWGPPTTVKIQCRDCEEVVEASLDLNPVSFFT